MYLLGSKICRRCHRAKPLTDFYLRRESPLRYAFCKKCMNQVGRELADEDCGINSLVSCRDTEIDVG